MNDKIIYEKIDYPLNNKKELFDYQANEYSNKRNLNKNIEIIYENKNNPTLYRCPICLSIPFLFYNKNKIKYKCNCGIFDCSIDYFFNNFLSYPIKKLSINNSNDNYYFCKNCLKFISESSKHIDEYLNHIIIYPKNIFKIPLKIQ